MPATTKSQFRLFSQVKGVQKWKNSGGKQGLDPKTLNPKYQKEIEGMAKTVDPKEVDKMLDVDFDKLEESFDDFDNFDIDESSAYKKGQKVEYQLYYKGGVGKFAGSISRSENIDTGVIKKRSKNKITGDFKYELTNGIELSSDEIIGLAESVNEANYPSFQSNKNIRYQDMNISSGYWTYMGKEMRGKGLYKNVNNNQTYLLSSDDIEYFKKHLKDIEVMESVDENNATATPGSVNGMGSVSMPGNPGTNEVGSGDIAATSSLTDDDEEDEIEKEGKKIRNFLVFNAFVGEMKMHDRMLPDVESIDENLGPDVKVGDKIVIQPPKGKTKTKGVVTYLENDGKRNSRGHQMFAYKDRKGDEWAGSTLQIVSVNGKDNPDWGKTMESVDENVRDITMPSEGDAISVSPGGVGRIKKIEGNFVFSSHVVGRNQTVWSPKKGAEKVWWPYQHKINIKKLKINRGNNMWIVDGKKKPLPFGTNFGEVIEESLNERLRIGTYTNRNKGNDPLELPNSRIVSIKNDIITTKADKKYKVLTTKPSLKKKDLYVDMDFVKRSGDPKNGYIQEIDPNDSYGMSTKGLIKVVPIDESVNEGKKIKWYEKDKTTGNKILDKFVKGLGAGNIEASWSNITVHNGVLDHNRNATYSITWDQFGDQWMVSIPGEDGNYDLTPSKSIKNDEDLYKFVTKFVNGISFSK